MAASIYIVPVLVICSLRYTVAEKAHAMDFRPNSTHINARSHKDCQAAYDDGWQQSGLYTISPYGKPIDVFCEQSLDGGWLVFQRRINGAESFFRNWEDYQLGFGDIRGEFWIGNDMLHHLTSHKDTMLKVELEYGSERAWSEYGEFWVDSEANKYKLHVNFFSPAKSNAGDSFHDTSNSKIVHDGQYFSTKDVDNDNDNDHSANGDNCSIKHSGAWWYNWCLKSNLNGDFYGQGYTGIVWASWKGYIPLSGAKMMLKKI